MGQGDSSPTRQNGSFKKQSARKQRSGLAGVLEGGNCERAPPPPRNAHTGGSGSGSGFFRHRSAPNRHFDPKDVPAASARCVPILHTHEPYLRQALLEEMAWQEQLAHEQQGASPPLPGIQHTTSGKSTGSGGEREVTTGESQNPSDQTAIAATASSTVVATAPTTSLAASAAATAARKRERRWWLMLCEGLIALQRMPRAPASALTVRDGAPLHRTALCVRRAIEETDAKHNPNPSDGCAGAAPTVDSRPLLASTSTTQRSTRPPSPTPTTTATTTPGASRRSSAVTPAKPMPRFSSWAAFPAARSTGVVYFTLAGTADEGGAAAADVPQRPPAEENKACKTCSSSDGGVTTAGARSPPLPHATTSSLSEDRTKSQEEASGLTAATTPEPPGPSSGSGTQGSGASCQQSGVVSTPPLATQDLCSLPWESPPAELRELPVGASYFAVLRKAWSMGPLPETGPTEWLSHPLDVETNEGSLRARRVNVSEGRGTDGGSFVVSSGSLAAAESAPLCLSSSTEHGTAAPLSGSRSSACVPTASNDRLTDDELYDMVVADPSAAVTVPAVSLSQMLRVLSPSWVGEGLYDTAHEPIPPYVKQLWRAREAKLQESTP